MKKWIGAAVLVVVLVSLAILPVSASPKPEGWQGPAGGSKPLENPGAAAKGYQEGKPEKSPQTIDGNRGQGQDKPLLAFPVISDVHVQWWHEPSQTKFANALNDLHAINPDADALVINGDLGDGMPADYDKLAELLRQTPHPNKMFYTIGNHEFYKAWHDADGNWNSDTYPNGESDQDSINRFLNFTGENKVYHDAMVKGYHFIFLGSEQYRQTDPSNLEDAYLSDEQLDWLKKTLKKGAGSDKPIFVFLHQPLPYTVSGTSFCCVNNRAIIQHEALKSILSDYPQVIFFSGHTHWELKLPGTLVRDKFTMVNSSSVVQPWTDDGNGGEMLAGPDDSEGLYVEVYKDKVRIQGRDFYRKQWVPEAQFTIPVQK
ncbi:metallophosphoesterase family protein [Cohnella nanjingensis]|uniref:metallophosphoesterase family protein n=1 Tax=Cohnella nanjingensis TaxID=1387779 RepID=UPI0028AAAA37|nr:metallophosphoesterase [Cohnella nanjingensis]